MEVSLIEKKGLPVKTKFKFTKREWNCLAPVDRSNLMLLAEGETTISSRYTIVILEGDYLNKKAKERMKNV